MVEKRNSKNDNQRLTVIEGGGPPTLPPTPKPDPFAVYMRETRPIRKFIEAALFFQSRTGWKTFDANDIKRVHRFFPQDFEAMAQALKQAVCCPTDEESARIFLATIARQFVAGRMDPSEWPVWVLEEMAEDFEDAYDGFSMCVIAAAFRALCPTSEAPYLPLPRDFLAECKRQREIFADVLRSLDTFKWLRDKVARADQPDIDYLHMNAEEIAKAEAADDAWWEKWGFKRPSWYGDPDAPF